MPRSVEAQNWDARYEQGGYKDEPPIEFVSRILEELGEAGKGQIGLYAGCGNGRNFIPLLDSGLNLRGVDISRKGLDQLIEKRPQAEKLVNVRDFTDIKAARVYDYIVAIQVFQHGGTSNINENFRQAHDILKPGGKLFLRVNSASTQIILNHHLTENNKYGGFTIVYDEEPKEDAKRHFFTHQELEVIAANNSFNIIKPLTEVIESRSDPQHGTWAQWETIWQKS